MLMNTGSAVLFKMLHLKKVGLFLASVWVVILVAAVAATIYREFDRGAIPFVKVGRRRMVPKTALIAYAAERLRGGGDN